MTAYLELADYLLIAERVLGLPAQGLSHSSFTRSQPVVLGADVAAGQFRMIPDLPWQE